MGMTLINKRSKALTLTAIIIILSVGVLLFWTSSLFNKINTHVYVRDAVISCTIIDEETGLPLSNMRVELNFSTSSMKKITVSGFTAKNGSITKVITNWNGSSLQIDDAILTGKWIIRSVAGSRHYQLNEKLWNCTDAKSFMLGYSKYSFKDIKLKQKTLKDHLEFSITLHVSPARILTVLNPIKEHISAYIAGSRGFRYRGKALIEFTMIDSNFVEIENTNFVLIPKNHPLKTRVLFKVLDFAWNFKIEINVTNREFIDLTVPILKEFSDRQIQEEINMLDVMSSQGFDLKEQYEKLEEVRRDYNRAIDALISANYTESLDYMQKGWIKYLGIYTQIREIHSKTLPWAITILSILVFFSFTSARLIVGDKVYLWKRFFPLFFLPFFLLFYFTQPYLRLFLLSPIIAIEKLDIIFFVNFLAVLPWLFLVFILAITPRFRDLLWETLEISLRNMYRRRFRSLMTILTITIVSASAMCVLSISPYNPSISIPIIGANPTVQQGLLIERYEMLTPTPGSMTSPGQAPQAMQIQIALPISEVRWLIKQAWIDSYTIYGLKQVTIVSGTGQNIAGFSKFNLVIINPSFLEKYILTFSNVSWLTEEDKGKVLVGSKIASAYHLSPGDVLYIDGKPFEVKGVFNEQQIVKNCKEIHGKNFFIRIYDPTTKTIRGESFIIGSINDFPLNYLNIYKISIVTKNSSVNDLNLIVDSILQHGYSHEITTKYKITRTYKVYTVTDRKVTCKFYGMTEFKIVGSWQSQMILLILSATIVSLNVIASVDERKKEIQTIFASGASPLRIRMIFIADALTFGLIGGVYGYVFMFSLVKIANLTLPNVVQENIISSSPFLISLSVGIIASLAGAIPISARAILSVIPSKRMLQRDKDIFIKENNRVIIEVPIKIQEYEIESFDNFIAHLADHLTPKRFYFDGIGILNIERRDEKERITYILTMNYSAEKNAFYKAIISIQKSVKPNEMEVFIYPLDAEGKVIEKWKTEHNITLSRFVAQLRSNLIKYVGTKK